MARARKRRGVRGRKAGGARIVSPLNTEMIRSEGRKSRKRKY